jgi:hypothetical protein
VIKATIHDQRGAAPDIALRLDAVRTSAINGAYPHEPVRGALLPPVRWSLTRLP